MSTRAITLVDLPKSLRKGIDRRLPRGSTFKDRTGNQYRYRVVLGFAGFKGRWTAWLTQCKCGNLSIATYKHLNDKCIPTCAMQLVNLPQALCKGIDRRLPRHGSSKTQPFVASTVVNFCEGAVSYYLVVHFPTTE